MQAEAVRAEQAHAALARRLEHLALQALSFLARLGEAAGQHSSGADTGRARIAHDGRHRAGRRDDDREVGLRRQIGQPCVRLGAKERRVLGIDRVERAAGLRRFQVAMQDLAERARALGGADQRDAARGEEGLKVVPEHAESWQMYRGAL